MLTWHALDGVDDYNISANELLNFLISPEEHIRGYVNRFIAHKRLNLHLARVIYEYENETVVVITYEDKNYYPNADALDIRIRDVKPEQEKRPIFDFISSQTVDS